MKYLFGLLIVCGLSAPIALSYLNSTNKKTWAKKQYSNDLKTGFNQYSTGLFEPDGWRDTIRTIEPNLGNERLPKKFDWREASGCGLSPIRAQGNCGSCWAFSTQATMTDVVHIKHCDSKDYSEQYLISCNTEGYGCNGGWWVFDMLIDPGAVLEKDMPYTQTDGFCQMSLDYQEKLDTWAFVNPTGQLPSVEDLKRAIYEYGPISVAVNADGNFMSYGSGLFNTCSPVSGVNHAVNLVGWNDDGGYWIMRNSWGKMWGEDGYMRIKWGCNNIGYAAAFTTYGANCQPQPYAHAGYQRTIREGEKTLLGTKKLEGHTYSWEPKESLDDSTKAMPIAKPEKTTTYKLTVKTKCGLSHHKVKVVVK